jgi:hypothetical protein
MQSTLDFDTDPADLTITVRGLATRDEFVHLYRELPTHPGFRPGMKILLDFWELDVAHLTEDDAVAIGSALAAEEARYGRAALAVFAPTTSLLRLTRIAEVAGGFEQIEVMIGATYDEAVAWLDSRPSEG